MERATHSSVSEARFGRELQRLCLCTLFFFQTIATFAANETIEWQRTYRTDVTPDVKGAVVGPGGFRGAFRLQTAGKPPSVRITEAKTLLYRDEDSNRRRYVVGSLGSAAGTTAWNAAKGPGTTIEIRLKVLVGATGAIYA